VVWLSIQCEQENITHYLAACQMLGFQPGELFDTTDLYEDKDMMRVRDGTAPPPINSLFPFFASRRISVLTGGRDTVARRSSKT
jgi:hypothetical protein